jgi:hypothetical protein
MRSVVFDQTVHLSCIWDNISIACLWGLPLPASTWTDMMDLVHIVLPFFWVYVNCTMLERIHCDNYTYAYNALCSHPPPCSYHPLAILKDFIWPLHICIQCTLIIFSLSVLFSPPAPAGTPQLIPYLHLSPYFPFRYSFCMRETSGMPFWVWFQLIWYPVPFCQFLETIFFSFFAALWFELRVSSLLGRCSCRLTCSGSPYNFILYCWILPKMFHTWIFLSYFEQRLPPWYFEISYTSRVMVSWYWIKLAQIP